MNIDLDRFFDDYRPIVHLTKEDFNIWYSNLQKDLNKIIKLAALSKPSVVSEFELAKVISEYYVKEGMVKAAEKCCFIAKIVHNLITKGLK